MVKSETAGGYGADVVFECTGFPNAIVEGIDMLRRGSSYVVAGHFTDVGNVLLNPFVHFTNKQINLIGVWGDDIGHSHAVFHWQNYLKILAYHIGKLGQIVAREEHTDFQLYYHILFENRLVVGL